MVQIFVEHWGDNLQFYPNFALFLPLGGMNLDHDFFQVSKLSEDKKIEHFFPRIQVKTKKKGLHQKWNAFPRIQLKTKKNNKKYKKGLHQKWNAFSPNSGKDLRSDAHQSQIIGGGGC